MRIIIFLFAVILLNAEFAYGEIFSENAPGACTFVVPKSELTAVFEANEHACPTGYYLPANHDGCELCPNGYDCDGGNFVFDESVSQGIIFDNNPINTNIDNFCAINMPLFLFAFYEPNSHDCSAGYYLPAGVDACTLCPANSACVGGTYSFNETTDQGIISCNGAFAPTGSAVCYQHILHVGNDNVYLRSTKQTTPSLNIQIGNDIFYANMTTTPTYMNKDSSHYLHILYEGIDYYVCDDTTYVAPSE